jgi:transcriptional regulator with XRE-family HTH domain
LEIYERIRKLRKNYLHLSQTEFGERLGVSRSVIKNIELNALAKPEQKMPLYKLICSEFKVNEDWILKGIEPMFTKTPLSTMEQLKKEFNLDDFSFNLIYEYLKLDDTQRKTVCDFFYRVINPEDDTDCISETPKTPNDLEEQFPPIKIEGKNPKTS